MKKILSRGLGIAPVFLIPYLYCNNKNVSVQQSNSITFKKRSQHLKQIEMSPNYDVIVIGGGCNGAGVVLDASTRGMKTLLIEKNDFASGTSSKSTKLIHGGVRYLEQVFALSKDSLKSRWQKFLLVKQAITERGVMIRSAEYMNEKVPFVIPCTNSFWSAYYYIGSVFYYLIYWFNSPKNTISFNFPYFLHRNELRKYLPYISDKYQSGVVYEDGKFNDARMVFMSLLTTTLKAAELINLPINHYPSNIVNQAQFLDFIKNETGRIIGVKFRDRISGKEYSVNGKYVVNCTGAWSDAIRLKDNPQVKKRIIVVGGSHITYHQRLAQRKYGVCLPSKDGRILLVVPWLNRFIAGTTEKTFEDAVQNPLVSMEQRNFIQTQMGDLMQKIPSQDLIDLQISKWAGLRPLVSDPQSQNTKDIARTHIIQKSASGLLSLMGGKWTTYRRMGEDLVNEIVKSQEQQGRKWPTSFSSKVRLLGSCNSKILDQLIKNYGPYGQHLYHQYGGLSLDILRGDLKQVFQNVTKSQLKYIIENEMVNSVQDVIMRRLRLSFLYPKQQVMQFIPTVAKMIYQNNIKNGEQNKMSLDQLIKSSIQTISSYEF